MKVKLLANDHCRRLFRALLSLVCDRDAGLRSRRLLHGTAAAERSGRDPLTRLISSLKTEERAVIPACGDTLRGVRPAFIGRGVCASVAGFVIKVTLAAVIPQELTSPVRQLLFPYPDCTKRTTSAPRARAGRRVHIDRCKWLRLFERGCSRFLRRILTGAST